MKVLGAEVILVKNGKILLVQQRKPQAYGLWSLPGGHVEDNETVEEAAHREVREEVGANLVAARPFKTSLLNTEEGDELELYTFLGSIAGSITLKHDELMDYGWFSYAELENMQDKLRNPVIWKLAREFYSTYQSTGELTLESLIEGSTPENVNGEYHWGSDVGAERWHDV